MVDVIVATYNHARFIRDALDGLVLQRTSFPWRAFVADDCSTDGTQTIIKEYADKYPDIVIPFFSPRNIGITGPEESHAWNIVRKHSTAKYLALLEGDDYWTSPDKLQKQVDCLEAHPECSMCFHNTRVVQDGRELEPALWHTAPMETMYTFEDLLPGNFINTPSVMYRSGIVGERPAWLKKMPMGDWPLYLLLARHGNIAYIDEVMAVYRVHDGGMWSAQSKVTILEQSLQASKIIQKELKIRNPVMNKARVAWHLQAMSLLIIQNNTHRAGYHATRLIWPVTWGFLCELNTLVRLGLKFYLPRLWKTCSYLKSRLVNTNDRVA